MTRVMLRMQQNECKRVVLRDIETEKRKVLDGKLVDFIQITNESLHGIY